MLEIWNRPFIKRSIGQGKQDSLPLQVGTCELQTPLLHVNVEAPNRSKPVKQVKFASAPWLLSLPCSVPLAGLCRRTHDGNSVREKYHIQLIS